MKISVDTYVMRERFGDKAALTMVKDAGFDCYDYSMYWTRGDNDMLGGDFASRAEELRRHADSAGIECNQAHAPFDLKSNDDFDLSNERYLRLVRSLECASILGAKNVIVHALKNDLPESTDFYELNRRFYGSLLPYCERFGICVSVENLFNWSDKAIPILSDPAEHMDFVNSLNSDMFNICLDIGHSAIVGRKAEEVVSAMDGHILKALHVHDNDLFSDLHLIPYAGKLDWNNILSALNRIGYCGEITFEAFGYLNRLPDELIPSGLRFLADIGRVFASKVSSAV